MNVFGIQLEFNIFYLIKKLIEVNKDYLNFNNVVEKKYNIIDFVENEFEFEILKTEFSKENSLTFFDNKIEYGDFQTPNDLTDRICTYIKNQGIEPDVIIEPTSGIGNFILSSFKYFKNIEYIYGIEINREYAFFSKFRIIELIEKEKKSYATKIKIYNANIFDFNFDNLKIGSDKNILILGNPPWVTNTTLSSLNSDNLPPKTNFKNHNGIDAITGKGNFDISEYITLMIIKYFQNKRAYFSFIVKNSVIKNIIFDQQKNKYKISSIKKINIDAQKEFNVSVNACVMYCEFNIDVDYKLEESSIYMNGKPIQIGWYNNKFVSNIDIYSKGQNYDGRCQFEWRSGIKHDCVKVLELKKINGIYSNGLSEQFEIEEDLVYRYLKGSQLKKKIINSSNLFTIITQAKINEGTDIIFEKFPKTYKYLYNHQNLFENRKSSIYKNKPKFSIFGIGDYSFKPYKIAIAGLYKEFNISLIIPDENNKPIMLDDTCYFLGFDILEFALIAFSMMNNEKFIKFIDSITFNDIKRKYTKDILMRIDFFEISQSLTYNDIKNIIELITPKYSDIISEKSWIDFVNSIKKADSKLVLY